MTVLVILPAHPDPVGKLVDQPGFHRVVFFLLIADAVALIILAVRIYAGRIEEMGAVCCPFEAVYASGDVCQTFLSGSIGIHRPDLRTILTR